MGSLQRDIRFTDGDSFLRQDKAPSERLSGVYVVIRDRELQAATSPLSVQQIILFWGSPRRSKN